MLFLIRWHWNRFKFGLRDFFEIDLPILFGRPFKHHAYCISDCGFETPVRHFGLNETRKECKAHANSHPECAMCRIIYHDRPGYEYILSDSMEEATK